MTPTVDCLTVVVCPAGGLTGAQAEERTPDLAPCARSGTERPGDAPALHLRPVAESGTWTATLLAPAAGTGLATITPEPDSPPTRVIVRAGGGEQVLEGEDLAVPQRTGERTARGIPVQVRLPAGEQITEISIQVPGGAVFLQDVFTVP